MLIVWPVIQLSLAEKRLYITAAIRAGSPIVLSGCFSSEDFNFFFIIDKVLQPLEYQLEMEQCNLPLLLEQAQLDRLLAKPSSADFEAAMDEWNVIPVLAATDEINTTEAPLSFFRLGKTFNNIKGAFKINT